VEGAHPAGEDGVTDVSDIDFDDERTLSSGETAELCTGCVKCCTYVAVEVDAPRAAWEYDQWSWALHHDRVSLYLERPERWYLHFETRCNRLMANGRCEIHGKHPVLCREYDPRSCERRLPNDDIVAWFHTAEQLDDWLRVQRPRHWERLVQFRVAAAAKASAAEPTTAGLISVQTLLAAPRRR
jgi:hypothetical protein